MSLSRDEIIEMAVKLSKAYTTNATWAAIVDFTAPPNEDRFFLVNVKEPRIYLSCVTSHGSGSGPIDGKRLKFSNVPNSHMSSEGLLKTTHTYYSTKFDGTSLRMEGLEKGINDNVYRRAIVIHPSDYVSDYYVEQKGFPGRSWGCVTLPRRVSDKVIDFLKNGSVVYLYSGKPTPALKRVL